MLDTRMPDEAFVLDTLYEARARLANAAEHFDFSCWTSCTCGFVFLAAEGRRAVDSWEVLPDASWAPHLSAYEDAIVGVARALGASDVDLGPEYAIRDKSYYAALYVSDATRTLHLDPSRADAQAVVERAITGLEAANEAARLRILAAAEPVDREPVLVGV